MYSFRSMSFALLNAFFALSAASPLAGLENRGSCRSTKVAVLGAGVAGITAAQSLSKADVKDFVIVEYNGEIGGRVAHTTFGKQKNGEPYTVELGANWVQGTVSPGGPENPIWTLAKKYNLQNTFSDYSSIETFDNTGANDFLDLLAEYSTDFGNTQVDADNILTQNLQDRSMRSGLSLNGWKPKKNMKAQAAEWWQFDWEYAYSPDESSELYAVANYNTTFNLYSQANNYVYDSRGFSAFIQGEASTYLKPKDSRLLLNTIVTNITYSDKGVTVHNKDGSCISAEYAICTFSLGVLQNDVVSFSPQLPYWKQQGIETFSMGTYTKIFMQFPADQVFWNTSIQFFLYADPIERGYYPVFQSLDGPGFLPGSGILFVTVVNAQSYVVEQQDDATTKKQVLAVLRKMYGHKNVPEPTAFMFPRWSLEPWAYGSYSNWPPGTSLEMHQNLRANVDRLWFAGEHTSSEQFGFLHGAYFEGQMVGTQIAACLNRDKKGCHAEQSYSTLHAAGRYADYTPENGWYISSFDAAELV